MPNKINMIIPKIINSSANNIKYRSLFIIVDISHYQNIDNYRQLSEIIDKTIKLFTYDKRNRYCFILN
jgi:hypothetical protein